MTPFYSNCKLASQAGLCLSPARVTLQKIS